MSSVTISGDTSGSIILQAPAVSGSTTLTLPTANGTIITTGSPQVGSVIQTVGGTTQFNGNFFTSTSTSFTAVTGATLSITPQFSSSKILVIWNSNLQIVSPGGTGYSVGATLYRGGTNLATGTSPSALAVLQTPATGGNSSCSCNMTFLDSPATTSSITYQPYVISQVGTQTVAIGSPGVSSSSAYTFILMEIKQ